MFWTPGWLVRHAIAVILFAGCLALGWWQLGRAVGGNALSYAYAVEWPVFAGFVAFVWYQEVRRARADAADRAHAADGTDAAERIDAADGAGRPQRRAAAREARLPPVRSTRPARVGPGYDDSDDEQLARYNRYLAWLRDHPQARPADYREG